MTDNALIGTKGQITGSSLGNSWGSALVLVAAAAGVGFFWFGIGSLFDAWQKPEYSHGYLIPFIAGFLLLKRLPATEYDSGQRNWTGFATVTAGVLAGFLGNLSAIPDIVTYGMLIAIGGFILLAAGQRRGAALWPAWVYLGFMLPLPNFIYWPLSIKLQFISSELGVAIIKLIGIPVFLQGNIIDLGSYQLQVAEACNGLRYLFPLMSFGFLFAAIYRGPMWHKCIIFLSAIPITIAMNSLRIAIIGFLVDRYGIKQAEGFLHFFEGWVIFAVCILLLFLLAVILQRLTATPQPILSVLDLDTRGLGSQLARFAHIKSSIPLVLATGLIIVAASVSTIAGDRATVYPDRERLDNFPMSLENWKGTPGYLDFQIERVLGADDYLMADYGSGSAAAPVNLLVAYYKSQTEGSGIHSPEVCIPAGGWEVSRWEQVTVDAGSDGARNFMVNRAIIQKGASRQLVYYWFEQRGRQLTNDYVVKVYTVWDSIVRRRSDGALVRAVTPIEGETVKAAEERLNRFLGLVVSRLPDFVPP